MPLTPKEKSEMTRATIALLTAHWGGPDWMPPDVRAPLGSSDPPLPLLNVLRTITDFAIANKISLPSLWETNGVLRKAFENNAAVRKGQNKSGRVQALPLTKKVAKKAYKSMVRLAEEQSDNSSGPYVFPDQAYASSTILRATKNNAGSFPKEDAHASPSRSHSPDNSVHSSALSSPAGATSGSRDQAPAAPRVAKREFPDHQDTLSMPNAKRNRRSDVEERLKDLDLGDIEKVRREVFEKFDAARVAKEEASESLMQLLHRNDVADEAVVQQAERVQARRRKNEAEQRLRQAQDDFDRSSRVLDTVSNMKRTLHAHEQASTDLEKVEKQRQKAKSKLGHAKKNYDEAWNLRFDTDDCDTFLNVLKDIGGQNEVNQ